MRIYLIGFMGSGKTTVGKKLSIKLEYIFVDLDAILEKEAQMSIPEYFKIHGQDKFRQMEQKVLIDTFKYENAVISCGGGTPCFFNNMDLINQNGFSVYIKLSVMSLFSRLKFAKTKRPLIANLVENDLFEYIANELTIREDYYKKASITVKGESINVESLVSLIQTSL